MYINKGNLFVFEVGPSVKFVSAIKDAIFKRKMGVHFFSRKKDQTGVGGSKGSLVKDFFRILFFEPFPNGTHDKNFRVLSSLFGGADTANGKMAQKWPNFQIG